MAHGVQPPTECPPGNTISHCSSSTSITGSRGSSRTRPEPITSSTLKTSRHPLTTGKLKHGHNGLLRTPRPWPAPSFHGDDGRCACRNSHAHPRPAGDPCEHRRMPEQCATLRCPDNHSKCSEFLQ